MENYREIIVDAENQIVSRVAKENLWTTEYTKGAMDEYKKYIFMSTFKSVCPSQAVDVVWHTHLLYTQSYRNMCEQLGKVIDHKPSDIEEKVADGRNPYQETKQFYRELFGVEPCPLFWSDYFYTIISVDLSKYWVIPANNIKFTVKVLIKQLKRKLNGFFRMVRTSS